MTSSELDVVIIGAGAIGSAAAYFLKRAGVDRICLIEPDPTYSKAATPLATGGCRRLFSRPENIEMSKFSIGFFKRFAEHVEVNGEAPDIGWKEGGYLFVVPPGHEQVLERNYKVQREHGVNVELLDRAALKARYPWMRCDDLALGALSPEDGWLDPNGVLQGFRKQAVALGVEQIKDRVVDLFVSGQHVRSLELASGNRIEAGHVINAAGTWAASLAKLAGMELPVNPLRRFEHYVEIEQGLPPMPLLKDPARLVSRPEGKGYSVGLVDGKEPRGFNFEVEPGYFESVVWPALAQRIPAFESLKLKREWAGLYDENELDGNMILGSWPGRLDNFIVACGFSGHGLMHAPAVGRAIAELVVHGRYETIDLTRMGYQRVLDNKPYPESGII
jgi:FAD-dependent oxidoreductase domain-containing protein 1